MASQNENIKYGKNKQEYSILKKYDVVQNEKSPNDAHYKENAHANAKTRESVNVTANVNEIHLDIHDVESLEKILNEHDIDYTNWGEKGTKTVIQLYKEIEANDCVLTLNIKDNLLIRSVNVLNIFNCYQKDGKKYILMEKSQQLVTGIIREKRDLPIAEKLLLHENWHDGLERAIKEELGSLFLEQKDEPIIEIIHNSFVRKIKENDSFSYPGLFARYSLYYVKIKIINLPEEVLPPHEFTTWENKMNPITKEIGRQTTEWQWVEEKQNKLVYPDGSISKVYATYLKLIEENI